MKIPVTIVNSYDPYRRLLYEGGDQYLTNLIKTNYDYNKSFQESQVAKGFMDQVNITPLEEQLAVIDKYKEELIEENMINDDWIYPIDTLEKLMNHNTRMGDILIADPFLRRRIADDRVKGFKREEWSERYAEYGDQYYDGIYSQVMSGVIHTPSESADTRLGYTADEIEKAQEEERYLVSEFRSTEHEEYLTLDEITYALYGYDYIRELVAKGRI